MQPRFGVVTQAIAVAFACAGLGAGVAILGASGVSDRLVLLALAVVFLLVATGIWTGSVWAWRSGLAIVLATIALTWVLHVPDGVGPVWLAVMVGFVVTGVQGRRDRVGRTAR